MSEYYGIATPSSDFIAHYGVKGMKWGVRKAIETGNSRRLERHYNKAAKKLEKLNERTDVQKQAELSKKYNKASKISRRIGHVGALAAGLSVPYENQAEALYTKQYNKYRFETEPNLHKQFRKMNEEYDYNTSINDALNKSGALSNDDYYRNRSKLNSDYRDAYKKHTEATDNAYKSLKNDWEARDRRVTAANMARFAGAATAAVGYGTAIGTKIKAHAAKKRTTAEGHAKAVAERNAWRNQMAETFKGTKYANLPSVPKKKKRR